LKFFGIGKKQLAKCHWQGPVGKMQLAKSKKQLARNSWQKAIGKNIATCQLKFSDRISLLLFI
jgi:hypothetical protein